MGLGVLIPSSPGLYLLVLELGEHFRGWVGSLGFVNLDRGFYVYLGSARGPGGLRARVLRHVGGPRRVRWHIDYLTSRPSVRCVLAVVVETVDDLEELVAAKLLNLASLKPAVKGFGSSDRRSLTHLFKCTSTLQDCLGEIVTTLTQMGFKKPVVVNLHYQLGARG